MNALCLAEIDGLTGGRVGTFDVPCPVCGPERRSPANRRRAVLRVWRIEEGFATFACARCHETGWTRDGHAAVPDAEKLAKVRAESDQHKRAADAKRLRVARWLWSLRKPITEGTPPWLYLNKRGYAGPIPATLSFLPSVDNHPPAMIAAFGLTRETEPGVIAAPADVRGVHLTKLTADGDKIPELDGQKAKIMIGRSMSYPIVLAAPNDLLAIDVTEGIEDGLTAYLTRGTGIWVAGAANRMPALAGIMPGHVECTTIFAHPDDAGQRHALELAHALDQRGVEVFVEGLGQ
jgi:hypothetical protein